jgi:glutathione S-transferase
MITLYSAPKTRGTRITWLLEELMQPYDYQLIDFSKGDSQSPEFLAINPAGKVPVMKEGELILTESAAIMSYLADKFSSGTLIPVAGTPERAKFDQWSLFALTELEQPLWTMSKHRFALPKKYRVGEVIFTAQWELQKALLLFSEGLGKKDYILGVKFSAVDILFCQTLIWAGSFKQDIAQKNLLDYRNRVMARPSYGQAIARENR